MQETESKSTLSRDAIGNDELTRQNKSIFALVLAVPILATIGYGAVDMWATSLLAVAACAIVVLWSVESLRQRELRVNSSSLQLPIIGLLVIGAIQLLPIGSGVEPSGLLSMPAARTLSLDPYATRFFVIRLLILLVFFAAALTFISNKTRFRSTVVMIVIFGAAMAFFGILQRLANPDGIYGLRESPHAIPFGSFVNQHHFAAFMNMTSGVTLGLIVGNTVNRDKLILLTFAAVVMGAATIFTGSRGGMLSYIGVIAFIAIALFMLRDRSKRPRRRKVDDGTSRTKLSIAAAVVGVVFVLLGLVMFLGAGDNLLRGIGVTDEYTDITSGRSHFWQVGLQVFLANPVIGAGLDAFGVAYTHFDTSNGAFRVEQAHNDYLQILTDAGILGFACVASFVVLLFKNGIAAISNSTDRFQRGAMVGALAGCFGILIHSFFDFPLRTTSNSFFFLLLVVLATNSIRMEKSAGRVRRRSSNSHKNASLTTRGGE